MVSCIPSQDQTLRVAPSNSRYHDSEIQQHLLVARASQEDLHWVSFLLTWILQMSPIMCSTKQGLFWESKVRQQCPPCSGGTSSPGPGKSGSGLEEIKPRAMKRPVSRVSQTLLNYRYFLAFLKIALVLFTSFWLAVRGQYLYLSHAMGCGVTAVNPGPTA